MTTPADSAPRMPRRYRFDGLILEVSSDDPAIAEALDARLLPWIAPDRIQTTELRFEYRSASAGRVRGIEQPSGPVRTVYDPIDGEVLYAIDEDRLYLRYRQAIQAVCDAVPGLTRVSVLQPDPTQTWLLSHPLFTLPFIESMKRRGRYSLHAAGLCRNGRGLIFPGGSGAGKTTLAIRLLQSGFDFLSDDMLFLDPSAEKLRVLGFPDEIDVTGETLERMPELQEIPGFGKIPGSPKYQIRPEALRAHCIVPHCRAAALIFPRIAATGRSALTPMDRTEALMALAPNVLLTEAVASQAHFSALGRLAAETVSYRLETGRDLDALPLLFNELLG